MNKLTKLLVIPFLFLTSCGNSTNNSNSANHVPIEVEEATSYKTEVKNDIRREGLKVYGELYIPENSKEEFPLVICSHGFGGNMSGTSALAKELTKIGFAAFAYDFVGGGSGIKSDGQLTDMSVKTEARDLTAVIEYLKEDERISQDNIFLLGQSQGGYVSTYVASNRNDIKCLIDYYPAFVIKDDCLAQYASEDLVPDPYPMQKMGGMNLGKIYWVDAVSIDIYEEMAKYEGNVLLMHGTSDNVVPYSYSERASTTFKHCDFVTYQNAGHGFSGNDDSDSLARSKAFLLDNLN